MEDDRSSFKILTGKPTGKRLLRRPRHKYEDNIRMDFKEIGINAGNWIDSAQDRNYCKCGIEPPGSISHGVSQLFYYVLSVLFYIIHTPKSI